MSSGINLREARVRSTRTFSSVSSETSHSSKPSEQFGKRRSRVSLMLSQLESSLVKEYKELMCETYEHNDSFFDIGDEGRSISFNSVIKDIQVKINYEITVNEVNALFTHELSVSNETIISDLIHMAVEAFNEQPHEIKHDNGSIDSVYLMTSKYSKYQLKPSKKNGKAKDVPSFCQDTTVANTQANSFTFLFQANSLIVVKVKDIEEEAKTELILAKDKDNANDESNLAKKRKDSCLLI